MNQESDRGNELSMASAPDSIADKPFNRTRSGAAVTLDVNAKQIDSKQDSFTPQVSQTNPNRH